MKMKIFVFLAVSLCAYASEVKETKNTEATEQNIEKRQTQDEFVPSQLIYRPRKQEQVTPVEEPQDEDDRETVSRADNEEYRPGQVFSLNAQELLELQSERKAPLASSAQLQQLYASPQQEHRQNLYFVDTNPGGRQVSLQPSHAVIARPHYSSNGGEASVGAALSVSDSGVSQSQSYDPELLALLGQAPAPARHDDHQQNYQQQVQASTQSVAPLYQQVSTQSVAPQYQQVDRYITKPSKKPTKHHSKVVSHIAPPQASSAPQQYLIETTNVQTQPQPASQQYRPNPQSQQRPVQSLRFVPVPANAQALIQQAYYERPESQGLKVVAPPKLQQQRPLLYRVVAPYQPQPEASPKQYRIVESPRAQAVRQEQRVPASSIERPVTYLKRFPEPEKVRAVKIYDPVPQEALGPQQQGHIIGEQYYLRPVHRSNEQRSRFSYDGPFAIREQPRVAPLEQPTKPPHSSIYVSQKVAPKKVNRQQTVRIEPPSREQQLEQVNLEQHGQSLDEQRAQLPPPKNNRAYSPEEFEALVAAGYSVTPIPVAPVGLQVAQSRSSVESAPPPELPRQVVQTRSSVWAAPQPPQPQGSRRIYSSRRHQYLPLRGDDAP